MRPKININTPDEKLYIGSIMVPITFKYKKRHKKCQIRAFWHCLHHSKGSKSTFSKKLNNFIIFSTNEHKNVVSGTLQTPLMHLINTTESIKPSHKVMRHRSPKAFAAWKLHWKGVSTSPTCDGCFAECRFKGHCHYQ